LLVSYLQTAVHMICCAEVSVWWCRLTCICLLSDILCVDTLYMLQIIWWVILFEFIVSL